MPNRRCTSNACLLAASRRSFRLDLPTANILYSPQRDWLHLTQGKIRIARDIRVDWNKFSQDRYLMMHCSIVASCIVGDNLYYIMPPTDELINNNGNGWANEVLVATFRTFIGAQNYVEHTQQLSLSKGKILDAVLRPVRYKSKNGQEADIFFCDILVATDRKFTDLIDKIEDGQLTTLSMGCSAQFCQCSKCGQLFTDDDRNCEHLDHELLTYFRGTDGEQHITAELCGRILRDKNGNRYGDPKSCKFIEASWVDRPAFKGAVVNYFVAGVSKDAQRLLSANSQTLQETVNDLFRMRVADDEGMTILRVAWHELRRRRQEELTERVAKRAILNLTPGR